LACLKLALSQALIKGFFKKKMGKLGVDYRRLAAFGAGMWFAASSGCRRGIAKLIGNDAVPPDGRPTWAR